MRLLKNQNGYTLLELLIVISILMMCYMFISPIFIGKTGSVQLNAATEQVANDLRILRTSAKLQGKVTQFKINENGDGYELSNNDQLILFDGDITLYSQIDNSYGKVISFYPDGTNSGLDLMLKTGENERRIISNWPSGKEEVIDVS